jgi:hypothetical protein
MMRVITVEFPTAAGDGRYTEMVDVLEASLRLHGGDVWLDRLVDDGEVMRGQLSETGARQSYVANTHKLRMWRDLVLEIPDDERVLLIDGDMLCTGDLTEALSWTEPVVMTVKDAGLSRFPFNSGVLGVRGGEDVRLFFELWFDLCEEMLLDKSTHEQWRALYGGINQASLGRLLQERADMDELVGRVPCRLWNAEESGWKVFEPGVTRLLHLKGRLRKAIFGELGEDEWTPELAPLVEAWGEARKMISK